MNAQITPGEQNSPTPEEQALHTSESTAWQNDPVMRFARDLKLAEENGQPFQSFAPENTGVGESRSSLDVRMLFAYDEHGAGVCDPSEVILKVKAESEERFTAIACLARQFFATDLGPWPSARTVCEVVGAGIEAACRAQDDDGVQLMHARLIAEAVEHQTEYWIAVAPGADVPGNVIYGSVSKEAYSVVRAAIWSNHRRPTNYAQLVRDVIQIAAPMGSDVDRLITLNGTLHPQDPCAMGR